MHDRVNDLHRPEGPASKGVWRVLREVLEVKPESTHGSCQSVQYKMVQFFFFGMIARFQTNLYISPLCHR